MIKKKKQQINLFGDETGKFLEIVVVAVNTFERWVTMINIILLFILSQLF